MLERCSRLPFLEGWVVFHSYLAWNATWLLVTCDWLILCVWLTSTMFSIVCFGTEGLFSYFWNDTLLFLGLYLIVQNWYAQRWRRI